MIKFNNSAKSINTRDKVACFQSPKNLSIPRTLTFLSHFLDVVSIERTGDFFRLLYDVKGRYILHKITAEEAKVRDYPPAA